MRLGKIEISFAKKGAITPNNTLLPVRYNTGDMFVPLGFFNRGVNSSNIDTTTVEGQRNAYVYCPAITAIVNQKVAMASNAKFVYKNEKGEVVNSKFAKLTDKPSPELTDWNQFFQLLYTLQQVHGRAYIYKRKLPGISQPEFYIVPNWQLTYELQTIDFWGQSITKYFWNRNGNQITIMPDEMIVINDTGFDLGCDHSYKSGQSRLIPLKDAVKNIVSAYECRGQMMDNGGPPMIISPLRDSTGASVMLKPEKDELERNLGTSYGWKKGQKKVLVASNPVTATKIGVSSTDLGGFQEVTEDFMECCRAYGAGLDYIFGLNRTTFNNLNEAKKTLLQNTTIPEVDSTIKQIKTSVGITDNFTADYSHMEELQESEKDKVDVFTSIAAGLKPLVESGIYTSEQARIIIEANTSIKLDK